MAMLSREKSLLFHYVEPVFFGHFQSLKFFLRSGPSLLFVFVFEGLYFAVQILEPLTVIEEI